MNFTDYQTKSRAIAKYPPLGTPPTFSNSIKSFGNLFYTIFIGEMLPDPHVPNTPMVNGVLSNY